jgi:mannose-6-phosphate isomerase-like protein (cupin superfamily)
MEHDPNIKGIHGYRFEPLAYKKRGKNMQPYILIPDFEPGEFLQHDGEEFLYILAGEIEFLYGTEKHILSEGDSAYFDSKIPHSGRSLGSQLAKVLIILYFYRRH